MFTKKEAIDFLNARYSIEHFFQDGFILSNADEVVRLISKGKSGESVEMSSPQLAVLGVRYSHSGNMNHPPAQSEEILWQFPASLVASQQIIPPRANSASGGQGKMK